ncbi:MAG: M28 family peptidase [Tannerella sp.]|jgi:Zn-dependent M28 family amino/carboxypeptidase|nr:M28 family peptidase [Tannerella sp.]
MDKFVCLFLGSLFFLCCSQKNATKRGDVVGAVSNTNVSSSTTAPSFDADSAYYYVAKQVAFGPRVPNTQAHKACAGYLATELERHGAKVYVQEAVLTAYNGDKLQAKNIIGTFNPDSKKRILLFAHWDSRPYSDQDADKTNHHKPVDGADDGASGIGVLLEIARQIGLNNIHTGIDILFFDAEDYGTPEFVDEYKSDTWCLGSQFWSKNPHVPGYKADFGILLDMVGHKDATFYKEAVSMYHAAPVVEQVWSAARNLGYGKYFINAKGGGVTDDHQYVISGRNIPCIDIINLKPDASHGFGVHWHTQNDTMDNIDKNVLKAVGQTVLEIIYN